MPDGYHSVVASVTFPRVNKRLLVALCQRLPFAKRVCAILKRVVYAFSWLPS